MTLKDGFLTEIQHAADQVGPVSGLDGAAMAHRAVRRGRTRRAALTTLGAFAAVGVVGGSWALLAPEQTPLMPASGGTPDGWVPVAVGGLALAVPPELEWSAEGRWEVDGPAPGKGDESFVQVTTAGEDAPLVPPGSDVEPVDVEVGGAESAAYVVEDFDDPSLVQKFTGRLQVQLESGEVVQVAVVWLDADQGADVFAHLVGSVSVDPEGAVLPPADAVLAPVPLDGVVPGVPDGWREADLAGLTFAVPPQWQDDEAAAEEFPAGDTARATSADGTSSITVVRAAGADGWPESIAIPGTPASTFPVEGADVVQVTSSTDDGVFRSTVHLRAEGGLGYIVDVAVPDTVDGRAQSLQLVGALGLTSGAQAAPGPDGFPEFDTVATPADWSAERWQDLRLALPAGWTTASSPEVDARWVPGAGASGESVTVMTAPADVAVDQVSPSGYRVDVPGADQAVVRFGRTTDVDGQPVFLGQVDLTRGDEVVVVEYTAPADADGVDPAERLAMLVDSLDLSGD
jgi:hypothetical protein